MNHRLAAIAVAAAALASTGLAQAATFSPNFSDYAFPGTQYTVDAAANAFFYTNYGIDVTNAYLYRDSRDTFDGIGIANGTVAEIGTLQSGRIGFIDLTDFVTLDYLAILPTTFSAYDSANVLLDTFVAAPGTGTHTLNGIGSDFISYLTFTSTGGYGAISGLTYNFDGTTGGGNTDLPPVPEPETYALMLGGLALVAAVARKRRAARG